MRDKITDRNWVNISLIVIFVRTSGIIINLPFISNLVMIFNFDNFIEKSAKFYS